MSIPKRILTNKNIAIKKCRHGCFMYYVNDLFIGQSLDIYGEWTENEFICLDSLIFPGFVVVDVGAYIGTHCVFFGQKVGPNGFVYAIEPQRNIFNLLCANVAMNNLLNVKCINAAAADKASIAHFPILDPGAKQNFGAIGIDKFDTGESIETITIDSLKLSRCNLIKIDVEGFQAKVLKGASETIKKFRPILYVENNTVKGSRSTLEILRSLKYKCFWHILPYYNNDNFFKNPKNVFERFQPEANMLCFPVEVKAEVTGFTEVTGKNDNWKKALQRLRISGK